jgi:serine phosphatase RsbU (regulator of sigma subunit)
MAVGLETAQSERLKQERMEHELQIARQLQDTLLPRSPQAPDGYELHARYAPALEVSGDYYDFIPIDARRMALVAADVSGKGVPGLVVMAMLRMILRGLAPNSRDPVAVLTAASNMLADSMRRGMFVTCCYGVLDAQEGQLTYVSAGHCPPLAFGVGSPRWLEAGGKPIGMFPQGVFRGSLVRREMRLRPGEGLVLYTDGLVESMDPTGRQLGEQKVAERLGAVARPTARAAVEDLFATVVQHQAGLVASDDLTVLAVRRLPVATPSPVEAMR